MVQTYPNVIIPVRKPKNGSFTEAQIEFNRVLSQERSVVERFFGRLKLYWGIMRGPYRSDRSSLDSLTKIYIALTNLKIRNAPLFADVPKGVILRDADCFPSSVSESSPTFDDFDDFPKPKRADRQPVKPPPKKRAVKGSPKKNGEKK